MMKITGIVTVLFAIIFIGGITFIVSQSQSTPTQKTVAPLPPTQAVTQTQSLPEQQASTSAAPADWPRYSSAPYGFSIQHPKDVNQDTTAEGERFYKLGPSQATGTELYDGISVVIKSGSLGGQTLQALVKQKHSALRSDPVQPKVGDMTPVTIAGMQGISFTVSSLGDITMIYLPKGNTEYLEITNATVEPANREQTFQKTVDLMISTIQYTNQ